MDQQVKSNHVTLLTLPPEIQSKIFSHLAVSFGKSSIQAVLRTCKQFYDIALPISVSIFRNTVHYLEGGGPCSSARNAKFLHYILVSKPSLAKYVKTVIIGSLSSEKSAETTDVAGHQNISTDEDLGVYQQRIETFFGSLSDSDAATSWRICWIEDLKKGSSDAQVTLILITCLNIHTLLFEDSKRISNFHYLLRAVEEGFTARGPKFRARQFPMGIPLSNLRDVFHETNDSKVGYRYFYTEAPKIFALPQLRFYECIMARGDDRAAERFRCVPSRSSPVEEINLHASYATALFLQKMLNSCRALKKFEFMRGLYGLSNEAMPRDILDAILPHANTLEDLYINLEDDWDKGWNWSSCPERLYMGIELSQMYALKRLTVGMQALTGLLAGKPQNRESVTLQMPSKIEGAPRLVDCLPKNLEYLKIHGCGQDITDQIKDLISVVDHRFKKLTYIGLLFHDWVMDGKVDLSCTTPNLVLDIGYQTRLEVLHNLGRTDGKKKGHLIRNMTSRIHAENARRHYLILREVTDVSSVPSFVDEPDLFEE